MVNHPGQTMTIYDVPAIIKEALPLAATKMSIMNGFKGTGVYPFNPNIFSDSDYMSSYVTDRPAPQSPQNERIDANSDEEHQENRPLTPMNNSQPLSPKPSTSATVVSFIPTPSTSKTDSINKPTHVSPCATLTPEDIRPFPKAGPRKTQRGGKRKRASAILTDTPVKEALSAEKNQSKMRNLLKKPQN